jgi:hypothetical protein
MSYVEVRDFVIWTKHIVGDPQLRDEIHGDEIRGQGAETVIKLTIDGHSGSWVKMADQPNGAPTDGIRPVGAAKSRWRWLYEERRGDLVEIAKA